MLNISASWRGGLKTLQRALATQMGLPITMISVYILSFPKPIIELVENQSLKPCVVLSSLFTVTVETLRSGVVASLTGVARL